MSAAVVSRVFGSPSSNGEDSHATATNRRTALTLNDALGNFLTILARYLRSFPATTENTRNGRRAPVSNVARSGFEVASLL